MAHPATTESEVERLGDWFHNLHLPGGVQTAPEHPLGDFPARKWHVLKQCLPQDLRDWRVLDVGCNAGYYSFALAARGADVVGIDVDERYLAQARWAAGKFDLPMPPAFRKLSVYGLLDLDQRFDLIWFMGVAYHLRHPLLALDILRELAPRYLMLQTMTFPDQPPPTIPGDFPLTERERIAAPGWPKLAFIESCLAGDSTNWWLANDSCARAMLRSSGFAILENPDDETWWCETTHTEDAVRQELYAANGRR